LIRGNDKQERTRTLKCSPTIIAIFITPVYESVNRFTQVAGFFDLVVYTQRRVPDTEIENGYKEEVKQESYKAENR